jgi:choline-sulfatase
MFFLPDQHRPEWLGCNADLPLRTPTLDRLGRRGVRFTNACCPSPLCAPSRASLASGRAYDRCGVVDNGQPYPLDQPTYYQALRAAGYRVCGVGKFDLDKPTLEWGLDGSRRLGDWGFTEGVDNEGKLDGSASYRRHGRPTGPYLKHLEDIGLAETYCREHARRNETLGAYVTAVPEDAYCDNWLAERGKRFLEAFPAGRPWHLVVNFTGPHNPMDVTARMRRRWEEAAFPPAHANDAFDPALLLEVRRNYAAMIENIDRLCGEMIEIVERRGELADTLMVYASDHGEMLGDHGLRGKCSWRHASVGVPLIVAGADVRAGAVSNEPVSLHDLAATFVDYARAEPMPAMDAVNLRPHLTGRTRRHREVVTSGLHDWRMAFDGRYKLIIEAGEPAALFDRATDPWEDVDLKDRLPQEVRRLMRHAPGAS